MQSGRSSEQMALPPRPQATLLTPVIPAGENGSSECCNLHLLPVEILEYIAGHARARYDYGCILRLRATCREIHAKLQRLWLDTHFSRRRFDFSPRRIALLKMVAEIDDIASRVRTLKIDLGKASEQPDGPKFDTLEYTRRSSATRLGQLIAPALSKLRNLRALWFERIDREVSASHAPRGLFVHGHCEMIAALASAVDVCNISLEEVIGLDIDMRRTSIGDCNLKSTLQTGHWTSNLTCLGLEVEVSPYYFAHNKKEKGIGLAESISTVTGLKELRVWFTRNGPKAKWFEGFAQGLALPQLSRLWLCCMCCRWDDMRQLLERHASTLRECIFDDPAIAKKIKPKTVRQILVYLRDNLRLEDLRLAFLAFRDGYTTFDNLKRWPVGNTWVKLNCRFEPKVKGQEGVRKTIDELLDCVICERHDGSIVVESSDGERDDETEDETEDEAEISLTEDETEESETDDDLDDLDDSMISRTRKAVKVTLRRLKYMKLKRRWRRKKTLLRRVLDAIE